MRLTKILTFNSHPEPSLISWLFKTKPREHFCIVGLPEFDHPDYGWMSGEYKDANGVLWSISFSRDKNDPLLHLATLTTIKPQRNIVISYEYEKV